MTRRYVDIDGWFSDFRYHAQMAGDTQREHLANLDYQIWDMQAKTPELALELCEKGIRLSQQLLEPCLELFYGYRAAEILLFYLMRTKLALDYATNLVTRASQQQYEQCPIRARIFITLIWAYSAFNMLGYEEEIWDMIAYMEGEIPLDSDTHQRLQGLRALLYLLANNYRQAEEEALKYLEMSAGSIYREMSAYEMLAKILYRSGDEERAMEYAILCEQKAQETRSLIHRVAAQLWQALFYRKRGDEVEAQRLFRRGVSQFSVLGVEKSGGYYDQLCRFYEAGKEYEKSLAIRDEQISKLQNTIDNEDALFDAYRKRCIVLKLMSKLRLADILLACDAAMNIRHSEKHLTRLAEIEHPASEPPLY